MALCSPRLEAVTSHDFQSLKKEVDSLKESLKKINDIHEWMNDLRKKQDGTGSQVQARPSVRKSTVSTGKPPLRKRGVSKCSVEGCKLNAQLSCQGCDFYLCTQHKASPCNGCREIANTPDSETGGVECSVEECDKVAQFECQREDCKYLCKEHKVLPDDSLGMAWTHRHYKSYNLAAIEAEERDRLAEDEAVRQFEGTAAEDSSRNIVYEENLAESNFGWEERNPSGGLAGLQSESGPLLGPGRQHLEWARQYRLSAHEVCGRHTWQKLEETLTSHRFEHIVGTVVLLNAVAIGIETDYLVRGNGTPFWVTVMGWAFCGLFTFELLLRIILNPVRFVDYHRCPEIGWNIFDVIVVSFQLLDCFVSDKGAFAHFSLFRICRIFRILRLVRVVRFFEELRTLLSSMLASLESLFWALIVLLGIMYLCAVTFCQILADVEIQGGSAVKAEMEPWFGSMTVSMLTMFGTISGATSWKDIFDGLVEHVGVWAGLLFLLYVITCLFAVTNAVTSVFVDKMSNISAQDKNTHMVHELRELFFTQGQGANDKNRKINYKFFKEHLETPAMKDFFENLDVDKEEAKEVFNLLDIDGSLEVDAEELVNGCLRLSGPAKALDVALVIRQNKALLRMLQGVLGSVDPHHKYTSSGSAISLHGSEET